MKSAPAAKDPCHKPGNAVEAVLIMLMLVTVLLTTFLVITVAVPLRKLESTDHKINQPAHETCTCPCCKKAQP